MIYHRGHRGSELIFFVAAIPGVRFKWSRHRTTLAIAHQDFDPAFGLIQTILAFARKLHALLEQFQAALEWQLALLKLTHNSLEFFQR